MIFPNIWIIISSLFPYAYEYYHPWENSRDLTSTLQKETSYRQLRSLRSLAGGYDYTVLRALSLRNDVSPFGRVPSSRRWFVSIPPPALKSEVTANNAFQASYALRANYRALSGAMREGSFSYHQLRSLRLLAGGYDCIALRAKIAQAIAFAQRRGCRRHTVANCRMPSHGD